jgi:hypothetical protein
MSEPADSTWESIEDRREERCRILGVPNPRCAYLGCPETDPLALIGTYPSIYCYEHDALLKRLPWLEAHHASAKANDPMTVQTPGNDHRVLSELQNASWPRETLRNPDGSPLLRAAAAIRGWLDLLYVVMTRTVSWVPAFLEGLDAWLRERIGSMWWDGFPGADSA